MTISELSLREEEQAFSRLLEDFTTWATAAGHACLPYAGEGPRHFAALPAERRQDVLARFAIYVGACRDVLAGGGSLANDRVLFWAMLRRLGLRPRADFLSHVELGDVIQIHDRELAQAFFSLGFLAGTSYALDDLLCRPFYELFRRDPRKTQLLLDVALKALDGQTPSTVRVGTGIHPVEEAGGPLRIRSLVENKVLAPLYDAAGRVAALASTLHCYAQDRVPSLSSR